MDASPPDLIDQCLSALSAETGLPLALDDQGLCALEHADGFVFTLLALPGSDLIHLNARLLDLPASDREAFLARLLRLNFLLMETAGATLAIDEEEQGVFLCHALLRAHQTPDRLLAVIGQFLASCSRLRAQLLGADSGGEPPGRSAPGSAWIAG